MKISNAILFQLNWFACVIGGTFWGTITITMLVVAVVVAAMISPCATRAALRADFVVILIMGTVGWIIESVWIKFGLLDYGITSVPIWIALLWVGVGLTINHSLSFLGSRPVMGAIFAGLAAPASYLAGEHFGAVRVLMNFGLVPISLCWGLLFYLVFKYAYFDPKEIYESFD